MIQRFEVKPFPSFPVADETKAPHHVAGDKLSCKVPQFIGRRKRQPRAFRGLKGNMTPTQDVELFHGRFEGRREVVAASLVGLEDAMTGHIFCALSLNKGPDALLNGGSIRASQAKQNGRRAPWCQETAPFPWVPTRHQT